MKMKYVRKLIVGLGTVAFTAAALTVSTYAWIVMEMGAEFREFELTTNTTNGLMVSLDGSKFSQDITLSQLKPIIEANNGGTVYGNEKYAPVTLKQDANGNAVFDADGHPTFIKDHLAKCDATYRTTYNVPDAEYLHDFEDANAGDYLMFDVWFRVINNGTMNKSYNLVMTNNKFDNNKKVGISAPDAKVMLTNKLTTKTKTYNEDEEITVNPADAMRVGIVNQDTNNFVIYEQNIGLGSVAIEGATDANHDKTKNAMLTYYNNVYTASPFVTAAKQGNTFNTVTKKDDELKYVSASGKTIQIGKSYVKRVYNYSLYKNEYFKAYVSGDAVPTNAFYEEVDASSVAATDTIVEINSKKYKLTSDTVIDLNKTYYTIKDNKCSSVTILENGTNANGVIYEVVENYFKTTDTVLNKAKTYYHHGYKQTTDTTEVSGKKYYSKDQDGNYNLETITAATDITALYEIDETTYVQVEYKPNTSALDDEYFELVDDQHFGSVYTQAPIHTFDYDSQTGYTDVKMTLVLWLEGWDADYFDGIGSYADSSDPTKIYDPNKMQVNFAFKLEEA